jgi:hypothetical protein
VRYQATLGLSDETKIILFGDETFIALLEDGFKRAHADRESIIYVGKTDTGERVSFSYADVLFIHAKEV